MTVVWLSKFRCNLVRRLWACRQSPTQTQLEFAARGIPPASGGAEELYAYRRDTLETQNLIESPDHAQAVAEFRTRLLDWFTYPDEGQSSVVGDSR